VPWSPADIAAGPDGNLWVTGPGGVARLAVGGAVDEFPVGVPTAGITRGPDGNLWFTAAGQIGTITPAGKVTTFAAPASGAIAAGPDGNLWFAAAAQLGRLTPAGVVTAFPAPHPAIALGAGPDGNVWFSAGERVAAIMPDGDVREFPVPTSGGLVAGPGGDLYATAPGKIVRLTTAGAVVAEFPAGGNPTDIDVGDDGNLWFTEPAANRVGRLVLP
jgi:streptogramin lyase